MYDMTTSNIIILIACLIVLNGSFILTIFTVKRKILDACFYTWYALKKEDKCTNKQINQIIIKEYDVIYTAISLFWLISVAFTVLIMCSIFNLW